MDWKEDVRTVQIMLGSPMLEPGRVYSEGRTQTREGLKEESSKVSRELSQTGGCGGETDQSRGVQSCYGSESSLSPDIRLLGLGLCLWI